MGEAGRGHGDEGCGEGGSEKFLRGGLEGKGERGWRRVAAPPPRRGRWRGSAGEGCSGSGGLVPRHGFGGCGGRGNRAGFRDG